MKKIFGILFVIIILGCAGYFVYINYIKDSIPKIKMEEETANINEYYIYGNHFNIKGSIDIKDKNYESICLTLYNGVDKDIEINNDIRKYFLSIVFILIFLRKKIRNIIIIIELIIIVFLS